MEAILIGLVIAGLLLMVAGFTLGRKRRVEVGATDETVPEPSEQSGPRHPEAAANADIAAGGTAEPGDSVAPPPERDVSTR